MTKNILPQSLHGAYYVYTDDVAEVVIAWFGSNTFNVYSFLGQEVDCFSTMNIPGHITEVEEIIARHVAEIHSGLEE